MQHRAACSRTRQITKCSSTGHHIHGTSPNKGGQQILCGRRSKDSGLKPPSLRVGLLYINLEPVAKGSLGLFHPRIQAKKRKHVVQGFCTG